MKNGQLHKFEESLAQLLRIGVIVSAVVVFAGGVMFLIENGASRPDYHVFHGERPDLVSMHRVVMECLSGHPRALVQTGIVLLIATPFARVLFSLFEFLKNRDWIYSLFTLIVFCVLAYGLFSS